MAFYDNDSTGLARLLAESLDAGRDAARKRAAYYRAKNIRALQMKADGMPSTLISEVLKGDEQVNKAMLEKDIAEAEYRASLDAHIDRRQQIRAANAQAEREWWS